ncbi:MAG: hypothetical protein DM484_15270 [Candidatus Methylumidiphilus alinenensis]|uniref:Uncharacterized protein n=1 Tax=Candidatus Methylumidiphilus alinenensis TaxID=2202197 RepID=A0A2W4QZ71_9GAMM|nr:MAG: hypothetical protein DM484_15270 [Candidatus Methylumidiphilus alinenensis]
MSIDIDQFTEAELINLNRRIVERLRFLQQMRAHSAMLKFSVGDRVCFDTDGFRRVTGTLVRYNKKTVSVLADDGQRWNVSPSFLRPSEPRDITPAAELPIGILVKK